MRLYCLSPAAVVRGGAGGRWRALLAEHAVPPVQSGEGGGGGYPALNFGSGAAGEDFREGGDEAARYSRRFQNDTPGGSSSSGGRKSSMDPLERLSQFLNGGGGPGSPRSNSAPPTPRHAY